MKGWHWGCIVLILVAYSIGALYPALFNAVRSKVGV